MATALTLRGPFRIARALTAELVAVVALGDEEDSDSGEP